MSEHQIPLWKLFLRILLVIAVVEAAVMGILFLVGPESAVLDAVVDAGLLAVMSSPFLFWFVIRPTARVFRRETQLARRQLRDTELQFQSVAETTVDGIIVADEGGRIRFWNDGAREMFGFTEEEMLGQDVALLMPERFRATHREGLARVVATGSGRLLMGSTIELVGLHKEGHEFPIELSLATWKLDDTRRFSGFVRDITERKQREEERETLIAELREAMEEIRTLRGFVPICSNCKKIRSDKGYWTEIEVYVTQHSEAQFSHGICPECVTDLYPELE